MSIITLSASNLTKLIRDKQISSQEVIKEYLDQIARVNPKINAIVESKPEEALETAKQLDAMQANGKTLGALHGLPFTVKDIFNVKGYKTTAGCVVLKDNVASEDATFVKRLKAAGAIFIGKTNTPDFESSVDTFNELYGVTRNPYDLSRSAGGSSGGCGAAVAACCAAFSIGADHGGSLRVPAHYNGITTIRSIGRIPSTGVLYGFRSGLGARFNAEGPLARYVDDLDLIMKVICGSDGVDPNVLPFPWKPKIDDSVKQFKLAYFVDNDNVEVMGDVKEAIENAARALASTGTDIQHDRPAKIVDGFEMHTKICGPETLIGFNVLADRFNITKPSGMIQEILKYFVPYQCNFPEYLQRWNDWDLYRSEILKFFEHYDAFICPVTASDALPQNTPMWYGKVAMISFCWAVSSTLLPAAVVRVGTSKAGLPIGIQIVSKPFREDIALAVAKQLETALGGWKNPNL